MGVQRYSGATVAQRLDRLAELYKRGQASELMGRTLDKMLAYEADVCQEQLDELEVDLAAFEQEYKLSSEEFFARYQQGQTDDRMDFVEWASLVQMADNLKRRLELLSGENTK